MYLPFEMPHHIELCVVGAVMRLLVEGNQIAEGHIEGAELPEEIYWELLEQRRRWAVARVWLSGCPAADVWEARRGAPWPNAGPFGLDPRLVWSRRGPGSGPVEGTLAREIIPEVLLLSHPFHPNGQAIYGAKEAIDAASVILSKLNEAGRLRLSHLDLAVQSLEKGLESRERRPVDLLLYIGHSHPSPPPEEELALAQQGEAGPITLSALLELVESETGCPPSAIFLAACDSAGPALNFKAFSGRSRVKALAGLTSQIGGNTPGGAEAYRRLVEGFLEGLERGLGFAQASQLAWQSARDSRWNGAVIVGLDTSADSLVPGQEEADSEMYRMQLLQAFSTADGPGGPVNLEDVYEELPLNIRDDPDAHATMSFKEALKLGNIVLVEAAPGAGKTTLLRAMARWMAKDRGRLPIYINLSSWQSGGTMVDLACRDLVRGRHDKTSIERVLVAARRSGTVALLLDGFDEAGTNQQEILNEALAFCREFADTQVVITTRQNSDMEMLGSLIPGNTVRVTLGSLEPEKIGAVAERWLIQFNAQDARTLVQRLKQNPEAWELARNPLLLRGMCWLFARGHLSLPVKVAALYGQMVRWMMHQRTRVQAHRAGVTPATLASWQVELLEELAWIAVKRRRSIISLRDIGRSKSLQRIAKIQSRSVLEALEWLLRTGLVQSGGRGYWFAHKTFEEYFAGQRLARRCDDDPSALSDWASRHLIDPEQGKYEYERFDVLRWATENCSPQALRDLVNWLLRNDSVLYEGTRLAARLLAASPDRVFEEMRGIVDRRLGEMLRRPWGKEELVERGSELRAYVQRRALFPVPGVPWGTLLNEGMNDVWMALKLLEILGAGDQAPAIVEMLNDPDGDIRRAATDALGKLGNNSHVNQIANLLGDVDNEVRLAAIEALGRIGNAGSARWLTPYLQVHGAEILTLKALERMDARAEAGQIVPLLRHPDSNVRRQAAHTLWRLGGRLFREEFIVSLGDSDPGVRQTAAEALSQAGWRISESMIPLLRGLGVSKSDQLWSVRALGQFKGLRLARWLVPLLESQDDEVRIEAAESLAESGMKSLVDEVVRLLESNKAETRLAALRVLVGLGDKRNAADVSRRLRDDDWRVQCAAVRLLQNWGSKEYADDLLPALNSPIQNVRKDAIKALRSIGEARHAWRAARLLKDQAISVRRFAAAALVRLGCTQDDYVGTIRGLLKDEDGGVRLAAAEELRQFGGGEINRFQGEFLGLLSDPTREIRAAAVVCLARIGEVTENRTEFEDQIVKRLEEQGEHTRVAAVELLATMKAYHRRGEIASCLGDPSPLVRAAAALALANMGDRTNKMMLCALLDDQNFNVRTVARRALRGLGCIS